MKEYIESLRDPNDLTSGNTDLLPEDLGHKYAKWESLEETFYAERLYMAPEVKNVCINNIEKARSEYLSELKHEYDTYLEQQKSEKQNSVLRSPTKDYIESLQVENDIFSGNPDLLPKSLHENFKNMVQLEYDFFYDHPHEKSPHQEEFKNVLIKFDSDWQRQNEASEKRETEHKTNNDLMERNSMKDYLESLSKPGDFLSGNPDLLPNDLKEKHLQFASLEEAYFTGERFARKEEKAPYTDALKEARMEYYGKLIQACETYLKNEENNYQQTSDMKEKKTTTAEVSPGEETKTKEKREPQMITVNGDKITHAHAFKSNQSEDWFYTAKINGVPLKAQLMDKNDVERVLEKSASTQEMMQKYYPSVLMPKVNVAEFKLPRAITTGNGEEQILKFNVYKESDPSNENYNKYKFYAQVGDKKMSTVASKQDLDAYFNRAATPTQIITKNFGDRLGMKEYYEQFKLPQGVDIETKDILLKKNTKTNRYEISVVKPGNFETPAKELSYDDRQSYFQHKAATKEQLAAKYLSPEIKALSQAPKVQNEKQMGLTR